MLRRFADVLRRNRRRSRLARQLGGDFQSVERLARIAARLRRELLERAVIQREVEAAQSVLGIGQGAFDQDRQVGLGERVEHQHLGPRQQRTDDLEGGVFGGGADQRDQAAFDVRQKGVLLGAVPAMDLVDEQDRALAVGGQLAARQVNHFAQVVDA